MEQHRPQTHHDHYANQRGHHQRSVFNRTLGRIIKNGYPLEVSRNTVWSAIVWLNIRKMQRDPKNGKTKLSNLKSPHGRG